MLMRDRDVCGEENFKTPTFLRRLRHLRPELVPGLEAGLRLTEIICLMLGIDSRDQVPDGPTAGRKCRRKNIYMNVVCKLRN